VNGDLGARADCVLLVDGLEVDRAWGIWVDAGSAVSCAFRHLFERLGTATLEVRLAEVAPADFDPANNAATASIDVILVPSAFHFDASFQDATFSNTSRSEGSWQTADRRRGETWSQAHEGHGREQHAGLWGWMPHAVTFPIDEMVIQQMTRDETAHFARFLDVGPDWTWTSDWATESCLGRWFDTPNGAANFSLCTVAFHDGTAGGTSLQYARHAGQVTYYSRGDSRFWDHDANYEDVWSWNYSGTWDSGRMVSYGREYGFFIRIEDAAGTHRMQPLVWLEPVSDSYESPWSCWGFDDEWGSYQSCSESRHSASGMHGWVVGLPTY
jgi:hypothetical protein